jgi:SAM-dependent methyltransferase
MNDFDTFSRQSWSTVAPDWGELIGDIDEQLGAAARWMIDAVASAPGEDVLELAGGPGTLSLMAAAAVGEEGSVICSDFAEPMVDTARRRVAEQGVPNVECRVIDAQAIDLRDGAVDVVLCRMGYMLMGDPAAALRETARVLRSGGRLALAVWSEADANPWMATPQRAIMAQLGAPAPPPGSPGLWALADEARLHGLLEAAGFEAVHSELLEDQTVYDSPAEWLELTARLAGPIRLLVSNLDDAGRQAITERLAEAAVPYQQADGRLQLPGQMRVASARKP